MLKWEVRRMRTQVPRDKISKYKIQFRKDQKSPHLEHFEEHGLSGTRVDIF